MTEYITVCNWAKFQHGDVVKNKIRAPAWIKLYTELLLDEDFFNLSEHRRLLLVCLWLEYARTRTRLPLDPRSIGRRLDMRVTKADLVALNKAGYIDFSQDSLKTVSSPDKRREDKTVTRAVDLDVATALDRILEEA